MTRRPNLVFIMSDDHAAHSISAYGSVINRTPNIDRIAEGGMRFDSCFCTNSICAPSRASILTGTYNHVNGVTTLDAKLDNSLDMFPQRLRDAGYQAALFGKWHLGRRFATRYEKTLRNYAAVVALGCMFLWLRV
jgi:arylsulfatase A-like enzyme